MDGLAASSPPRAVLLPRPTLIRTPPSALETGHEYANQADRYERAADFKRAAEMAQKASESYKRAAEDSTVSDSTVKLTMMKLHEEHNRRSKDLMRRHERSLREAARPRPLANGSSSSSSASIPRSVEASSSRPREDHSTKARANGIDRLESAMASGMSEGMRNAGDTTPRQVPRSVSAFSEASTIPPGESFMMLADRDPSDPFNQFWNILQGMLQNLSGPVAFATVPLNGELLEPPDAVGDESKENRDTSGRTAETDGLSDDDFDKDSFYIIPIEKPSPKPHVYPPRRPKTQEELLYENQHLKASLDAVTRRLEACQLALRQKDLAERMNVRRLQGSLLDVRNRMQASVLSAGVGSPPASVMERELRPSEEGAVSQRLPAGFTGTKGQSGAQGLGLVMPGSPMGSPVAERLPKMEDKDKEREKDRDEEMARLQKRIRELEEENVRQKGENEKLKDLIKRYKEKWEKLKESAKKKKEAKAAAAVIGGITPSSSGGPVGTIVEDAEGEAEGDV